MISPEIHRSVGLVFKTRKHSKLTLFEDADVGVADNGIAGVLVSVKAEVGVMTAPAGEHPPNHKTPSHMMIFKVFEMPGFIMVVPNSNLIILNAQLITRTQ